MNLSGLSPFFSAVGSGMTQGAAAQEELARSKLQTQELQDDRAALAILGRAFGVAPPPTAPQPAPGQASQPAAPPMPQTSTGQPVQPPGAYLNPAAGQPPPVPNTAAAPAPPGVQAAPPGGAPPPEAVRALQPPPGGPGDSFNPDGTLRQLPPAAAAPRAALQAAAAAGGGPADAPGRTVPAPAPPPAPSPAAAPPGAPAAPPGAGNRPSIPPVPGQMTTNDLAALIMKANPGLQKRPDLLIRAMVKGQQLLAPDAKAELQALQLQQKIDAANQNFDAKLAAIQGANERSQYIAAARLEVEKMQIEIAKLKDAGANNRLTATLEARIAELDKKIDAKHADVATTEGGKDKRLGMTLDSKERIAAATTELKKELGNDKFLLDNKKIEGTQWYQKRMTELKEQQLSDTAIKAQMEHEVKLIQEAGRDTRNTETVAGRKDVAATNAGARAENQGVSQQYRSIGIQMNAINKKIAELLPFGTTADSLEGAPQQAYASLVAQRDSLAAKAKALGDKAAKAGSPLPKLADVMKEAGEAPADDAVAGVPEGLPDTKGLAEGTTAKDGDKVVAIVKDGQWVVPPAAP